MLSSVPEQDDEDPVTIALNAVNKIMAHVLKQKEGSKSTSARPEFRSLKLEDIDSAYRSGRKKKSEHVVL